MTSILQETTHKANVAASESTRQTALAAAKAAFNGTPAAYPAYALAVKNADAAHFRTIIASCAANDLGIGPRASLYDLVKQWT